MPCRGPLLTEETARQTITSHSHPDRPADTHVVQRARGRLGSGGSVPKWQHWEGRLEGRPVGVCRAGK